MLAEPVGKTGDGGEGAAEDYILIRDEKASGVDGGTFTAGSWQTRDLNTKVADTGNHAALAGNQITLAAGTYKVRAIAPSRKVNFHKTRLRNITDGSDLAIGSTAYSFSGDGMQDACDLVGRFTIASSKVIELQHRCTTSAATNGFGIAASFGVIEIYSIVQFWKEA